ncbi:MAG: hypothetical protein NTX94_02725 [Caldiserica bacterium]|nr:hypothetical protein [Caldisericota bacterium]
MDKRRFWSRILCVAGIVVSVLGDYAYSGGSGFRRDGMRLLYLLSGSGLAALGASLGRIRHRTIVYCALGLAAISVPIWTGRWVWLTTHGHAEISILTDPLLVICGFGLVASLTGAVVALFDSLFASVSMQEVALINTRRRWWSGTVSFAALAVTAVGIVTHVVVVSSWLWGFNSLLILLGSGLAALGAFLGRSRYRKSLYGALGLTVCGLTTIFCAITDPRIGIDFSSDALHPAWWQIVAYAYLVGAVMSCVGTVLVVVESFRRTPVSKNNVEVT